MRLIMDLVVNHASDEQSWEITEPAIYYQASFVMLISKFVD